MRTVPKEIPATFVIAQTDVQWVWEAARQDALQALKRAVAATPVLCYFNLEEELTLQWDASQFSSG